MGVSDESFNTMKDGWTLEQASMEANRCLLCHDAPCSRDCPADTMPDLFIRKLRMGAVRGAIRTIKVNNILGGACGVLCPTERLCESACNTTNIDSPIKIGKIQYALMDHYYKKGPGLFTKARRMEKKVAVVGSGPAGLSCAAELAKQGVQVTVYEKQPAPGGVIRWGVPAKRYDISFLEKELQDIRDLGVEIKLSSPINGKDEVTGLLKRGFDAVFLAVGLWEPLSLFEEQKNVKGLYSSIEFLANLRGEDWNGFGRSFTNKVVAVVGGGSVAIDCAVSALKLGARDVFLIYRRSWPQMPAEEKEKIEAAQEGIHFLLMNQPKELVCNGENLLKGLKLIRTKLGEADSDGRRSPVMIEGSEWVLEIEYLIEAIGNNPSRDFTSMSFRGTRGEDSLIDADPRTGITDVDGVFSGGDLIRGPALVVEAVQDGKIAAGAIFDYLGVTPPIPEG